MSFISSELNSSIQTIYIDRPDKKNALTQAMYQSMADAINEACANKKAKVIIITSQHDFFTAGNDLEDFINLPSITEEVGVYQFLLALVNCSLPLIAAVQGPAIGIGTTLLLHCERVIADKTAVFALPFINLGLVPEAGSSLLLPRMAGYQEAADLLLTGDRFDVDRASNIGLVSEKVDEGKALIVAQQYASRLVTKPRATLIDTKKLLRRREEPLQERMDKELTLFGEKLKGPEVKEAVTAFFEKRAPDFSDL